MTGLPGRSPENLAEHLIQHSRAQVVVIKLGAEGSLVHDGAAGHRVPAYQTKRVWKIGSGDNFVAHFAFHWMNEGKSPVESADLASQGQPTTAKQGFMTPGSLERFQAQTRSRVEGLSCWLPALGLFGRTIFYVGAIMARRTSPSRSQSNGTTRVLALPRGRPWISG